MRDDALAAGAIGVEVPLLRMTAFLLASVYGGLAGVLYAGLIRYVAPETFSIANMFLLLAMVIIGGRQNLLGCVVGAIALAAGPRAARRLPDIRAGRLRQHRGAHRGVRARPAWPGCRRGRPPAAPDGLVPGRPGHRQNAGTVPALRSAASSQRPAPPGCCGSTTSACTSGASGRCRTSRWPWPRARSVASSAPTDQARRPCSTWSAGSTGPTGGRVVFAGRDVTGAAAVPARAGRHRPNLPEPAPVPRADRARQHPRGAGHQPVDVRAGGMPLWQLGVWRHDRRLRSQAGEMLARFGLTDFADRRPARPALRHPAPGRDRPGDGPPAAVAPARRAGGRPQRRGGAPTGEIVRSIRASGVTVIIIEHNMGLVMSLCDRITVLASGTRHRRGQPGRGGPGTPGDRGVPGRLGDVAATCPAR